MATLQYRDERKTAREGTHEREFEQRPQHARSNSAVAKHAARARAARAKKKGVVPRPRKEDLSGDGKHDAASIGVESVKCGEDGSDSTTCFLSSNQRDIVRQRLGIRTSQVSGTFAGVVNERRIKDALKPKGSPLGFAVDLLYVFMRVAAPQFATAISTLTTSLKGAEGEVFKVTERVFSERVEKVIGSAFVAGSRTARTAMKSLVGGVAASTATEREKFLNGLETEIKVQLEQMAANAMVSLGDAELIAFTAYWDQRIHTPQRYRAELNRLLAAQARVEAIGTHPYALRVIEGPEGRRRLAHCKVHRSGFAFVAWVDDRFLKKSVAKNRQMRARSADLFTGVTSLRYDHHLFVMADGRSRKKGLAKDHPEMKRWIEESAPMFVQETFDPATGTVSGGGTRYPDSFDQVKSHELKIGPLDDS